MKLIKKIAEMLLRRESKKIIKGYNQYIAQRQTPPEVLESLRSVYDDEMLNNDLKAIYECIYTIKNTSNPSIVLDRHEYGLIKAYNLRQLEEAGVYKGNTSAQEYIDWFRKNKDI